jgi:hypothetical protein
MITPKFRGKILNGRFFPFDEEMYSIWNSSLNEKICELTIKEYKKQRSNEANRYYWGVVVKIISEETGYTPDEVHSLLSTMFLKDHKEFKGRRYTVIKSSSVLKTDEFHEFIEKSKRWASIELGLYIPDAEKIK